MSIVSCLLSSNSYPYADMYLRKYSYRVNNFVIRFNLVLEGKHFSIFFYNYYFYAGVRLMYHYLCIFSTGEHSFFIYSFLILLLSSYIALSFLILFSKIEFLRVRLLSQRTQILLKHIAKLFSQMAILLCNVNRIVQNWLHQYLTSSRRY